METSTLWFVLLTAAGLIALMVAIRDHLQRDLTERRLYEVLADSPSQIGWLVLLFFVALVILWVIFSSNTSTG